MKKILRVIGRIFTVIIITLALTVLFLLGTVFVLVKGPSPAARELFVLSVKETSAAGFLAHIFLSNAQVEEITGANNDIDIQSSVNTALIVIAPVNKNESGAEIAPRATSSGGEEKNNDTGIEIKDISGTTFRGKLMIVSDPSRVFVGTPDAYGDEAEGMKLTDMIKKYGCTAGINAGGFVDPAGTGNGGTPDGLVMDGGKVLWGSLDKKYDISGFDENNILIVGRMTAREALEKKLRCAVSFGPALVINGKALNEKKKLGGGLNPRSAIGQREDGAVLLLVIEGRQMASLGATYDDLADIMLENGAVNASNLDGGSSSLMTLNGQNLTTSSYFFGERVLASSFLVK